MPPASRFWRDARGRARPMSPWLWSTRSMGSRGYRPSLTGLGDSRRTEGAPSYWAIDPLHGALYSSAMSLSMPEALSLPMAVSIRNLRSMSFLFIAQET